MPPSGVFNYTQVYYNEVMRRQRKEAQKRRIPGPRLPYFLMGMVFWAWLIYLFFWVDPFVLQHVGLPNSYSPIFLLTFLAVSLTVGSVRNSAVKGLAWGGGITLFLILSFIGMGHVVNGLLIFGLLAAAEYYWFNPKSKMEQGDSND